MSDSPSRSSELPHGPEGPSCGIVTMSAGPTAPCSPPTSGGWVNLLNEHRRQGREAFVWNQCFEPTTEQPRPVMPARGAPTEPSPPAPPLPENGDENP